MVRIRSMAPLGAALALAVSGTALAQNEKVGIGYLNQETDAEEISRRQANAKIVIPPPSVAPAVRPLRLFERAAHVANGTAMRNRVSGTIALRGVPLGSSILQAYLFWNYSDNLATGPASVPVLFNGNVVPGRKTADNSDPCWGHAGNHSYVADVTAFTNQTGGPNQDYEVTLPFNLNSSTTGQHPWAPFEVQATRVSGATLVVVYQNSATTGPLAVYAPAGDNMFFFAATYNLFSPGVGASLLTSLGADGQRGFGHNNFASNEITRFNAVNQIAGPPVAASDWDGSDGLPLPQMWDTHTHEVNVTGPISTVDYTSPGDCIVPVGFVLDVLP